MGPWLLSHGRRLFRSRLSTKAKYALCEHLGLSSRTNSISHQHGPVTRFWIVVYGLASVPQVFDTTSPLAAAITHAELPTIARLTTTHRVVKTG